MYHAVSKGVVIGFSVTGSRRTLFKFRNSSFVKVLDLMNIMAAGSKTKVQDVNLKCTCPVCFSR